MRSRGPLLGAKTAKKSGLGAFGSMFEPSLGAWRLPEGSWMHLGALLAALGELLERLQGRESARGELEESSGRARGEIRQRPGEG